MAESPGAGDVLVDETQILLTEVIAQVGEGLRRYGLSFEAGRAGKYNIELRRVVSRRYISSDYPGEIGIKEGNSWPVLVVRDRVKGESVGGLIIREEERDSQVYSTHRFSLGRENSRGGEDGLLSGEVEERDNEWWIRNHDGRLFSLTPREGGGTPVKCLALLYQRKFIGQQERLMITPFSVALTREQLHWLEDGGSFPSLSELVEAQKQKQAQPVKSTNPADLREVSDSGEGLFSLLKQTLGADPQERVKDGIVGDKYRTAWADQNGAIVLEGEAHRAGYFDKDSMEYIPKWGFSRLREGRGAVTTHIFVKINQVSRTGLDQGELKPASFSQDSCQVELFLLADRTIKLGFAGTPTREVNEPGEKRFWESVLTNMRARREKPPVRR